jgi:hypothetical protein
MLFALLAVGLAGLWYLVVSGTNRIISLQEAMMAQIDDAAAANAAKVDALIAKQDETIVTLRELKDLVGGANPDNALAVLAATGEKLDVALSNLTTAENETDPTPDA